MMKMKVWMILPDYNTFKSKDTEAKVALKDAVKKWLDIYNENNWEVVCLAEDMLAASMLNEADISWVSSLGTSDRYFLSHSVDGYPESYSVVLEKSTSSAFIKNALTKHKVKPTETFGGDEIAMVGDRFNVLNNRSKFVVEKELEKASAVIYFKSSTNFCREPKPELGDGKLISIVDTRYMLEHHYYGGVAFTEEDTKRIIGGLSK